jgi:hypothetical protein
MTCSIEGHHPRPTIVRVLSVKLDRLAVGTILKQEGLSKSVSDRCERKFVLGLYRPLHILLLESLPNVPATNGRWMGIDNESNQVK